MFERFLRLFTGSAPVSAAPTGRRDTAEAARAARESQFGPFAAAFDIDGLRVPGYLVLLNLREPEDPEVRLVLDRIERALDSGETGSWVTTLFNDPDWRPHLVGALAALLSRKSHAAYVPGLWQAMDRGSWVTPQLAATAQIIDPDFGQRAMERVGAGCPISVPQNLTPLERHSATGPTGGVQRSAKLLGSLLALGENSEWREWAEQAKLEPENVALLGEDIDDSGQIALRWSAAVREVLCHRRRRLGAEE